MAFLESRLGEDKPLPKRQTLRAVLTRALEQQHVWREAVERAGFECESLPLFRVDPLEPAHLLSLVGEAAHLQLIVAISPNAAQGVTQLLAFAEKAHPPYARDLKQTRYAVPGPGTRDALIRGGIAPDHIICPIRRDQVYDAQAMLQAIRAAMQFSQLKPGKALIVHGEQTSPEITIGLSAMGMDCRSIAAYRHGPVTLEPAQTLRLTRLLTSAHEVVWVLSQTRAVTYLHDLAHALRPSGLKGHRALAIHPRIVNAAQEAGFAQVRLIEPSPVALVGALLAMSEPEPRAGLTANVAQQR